MFHLARDAFNAFDFLGEGFVSANDVKEALMHIMEKAPDSDKENIINHFRYKLYNINTRLKEHMTNIILFRENCSLSYKVSDCM